MNWYRHPNNENDYIRIRPSTDRDWEMKVIAEQPAYTRMRLALTDKERRKREGLAIAEAVAEAAYEKSPPPNTWLGRLKVHYQAHESLYGVGGAIATIVGLALALVPFL